jgi:putative ABC transport system permease protein
MPVDIIAGRNFDKQFTSDPKNLVINEALCAALQFRDAKLAVGERLVTGSDTMEIVGVVADFHQMSLKAKVIPLVFRLFPVASFYSLKLETENYKTIIESIEEQWQKLFPDSPMDYFFLDQFYNRQYERDDRFSQVFTLFTVLAIFIASLGLLGLASFMALQRTKEIGIRKVLGASAAGIVGLLSRGFMQPVLIAIVIACPLGWWLMEQWLQSFPYRVQINPWVFLVSGILVLFIAFISVSSQTLKAAVTKPADTLIYE